jgi:transcriptional regulator with XRE-family HTH domain
VKSSVSRQKVSGAQLRRVRSRARLKQIELARRLGVLQQRVSAIESTAVVTQRAAVRYLAGVSALVRERENTTPGRDLA